MKKPKNAMYTFKDRGTVLNQSKQSEIFRNEFLGQKLNFKLASTMGHKGKIIPQPSTNLT